MTGSSAAWAPNWPDWDKHAPAGLAIIVKKYAAVVDLDLYHYLVARMTHSGTYLALAVNGWDTKVCFEYIAESTAGYWVAGEWINAALSKGTGTNQTRIYKNGNKVVEQTFTSLLPATFTDIGIGWSSGASLNPWVGDVRLVAIWNRVLTDIEHASLSANPWQIFRKQPQVLYFDVGGATGVTGTGSLTTGAMTASGTGTISHTGTGSLTNSVTTLSGTGTLTHAWTGALTTLAATLSGAGVLTHVGTGDLTTAAVTVEHMMFQGTGKFPAGEFSRIIALNGGTENAFTAEDFTAYFQTLERSKLELALKLEADRMQNLVLSKAEFEKEIEVVRNERRWRTDDQPHGLVYEQLNATAFQSHPYNWPVIGWMNDLENMKTEDARAWYDTWYAPNNAVLVVAGDVQAETVFKLAQKYFGPLKAKKLPGRKPQEEPAQKGIKRVAVKATAKLPGRIARRAGRTSLCFRKSRSAAGLRGRWS